MTAPSVVPTSVVETASGPVEITQSGDAEPVVLFFPGGHCTAAADCGWDLYTSIGYRVLSVSRPGYGRTDVGPLSAGEFVPAVREVCAQLGITEISAVVGVSFGGLQAIELAGDAALKPQRLVLHSCAPSRIAYPDTRAQAIAGPAVFSPALQGLVWALVRQMVRSDAGLKRMLGQLSNRPADEWWDDLSAADRERARTLFLGMTSGSGFVNDLRQATRGRAAGRARALARVACPTLITGSRHDAGVAFAHAEDFARAIDGSRLVEANSATHLFWLGPEASQIAAAVRDFMAR